MRPLMVSVAGVRGVIGESLTTEIACRWGAAFGTLLGAGARVIIGRDSRGSGPVIEAAVTAGLRGAGCSVRLAGVLPTPTIQLATRDSDARGGIAITASHNPLEWNALKFIREDGLFLSADEGRTLRAIVEGGPLAVRSVAHDALGGEDTDDGAAERHIDRILSLPYIDVACVARRGLRVVVDCGNGAGSFVTPRLLERLGADVTRLYCEPDGRFPRHAEPRAEHLGDLVRRVRETGADLGLAHDPDADRIVFVTGSGRALMEEYSLAIACELILSSRPGGVVVTNLSTSQMIDEIAARHGARVERTAIGEANVSHRMRDTGSIIGGEGNGGVIQPAVQLARDGPAAAALVLMGLAERGATLDQIVGGLPSFVMAKREVVVSELKLEHVGRRLEEEFGAGETDRTDGLKITWGRRWIHVRQSGTEPIVRIIAEAPSQQETTAMIDVAAGGMGSGATMAPH
ncbi:MAG: phosphoglucosamine mutase [bacterium]